MKFDQTCRSCGLTEAAGAYCARCFARSQESWFHRPKRSAAQVAAFAGTGGNSPKELRHAPSKEAAA
jgi:hypothetical protein